MKTKTIPTTTPPSAPATKMDLSRVLSASLGVQMLGCELTGDLYLSNGFRFLGTSACADRSTLELRTQRARIKGRRQSTNGDSCIRTGYDHLATVDPLESISRLRSPCPRTICELFWPHVSPGLFGSVEQDRHIASKAFIESLEKTAVQTRGLPGRLAQHALAVAYHNLAMTMEIAHAEGRGPWEEQYWQRTMEYWRQVHSAKSFWEYMKQRVAAKDDLRLQPTEVEDMRRSLLQAVLAFHSLFARAYAQAGRYEHCRRHLSALEHSPLPDDVRRQALVTAVTTILTARLDPLIRQAETAMDDQKGKPIARGRFAQLYEPILIQALEARVHLLKDLGVHETLVEQTKFDRLCSIVHQALDTKLDYRGEDRERAQLYRLLTTRRILQLPLSDGLRAKLEHAQRTTAIRLYDGFDLPTAVDPSVCFFLEGELADPDSSILLPVYKITDVKGLSVSYEHRQVMVTRSAAAAKVHSGQMTLAQLTSGRNDEATRNIQDNVRGAAARRDAAIQQVRQRCEQDVQQAQAQVQAELARFDQSVAEKESAYRHRLDMIQAELEAALAKRGKSHQAAVLQLQKNHDGTVRQITEALDAAKRKYGGINGVFRVTLPGVVLTAMLLAGGAFVVLRTDILSARQSGIPGLEGRLDPSVAMVGAAAVIGAMFGWLLGGSIRRRRVHRGECLRACAERTLDSRKKKLESGLERDLQELRSRATKAHEKVVERLATYAAQRRTYQEKVDSRTADLQAKSNREIKRLTDAAAKEIAALEERLKGRVKVRPEAEKTRFPAYLKAKSNGYRDGLKPSQSEVRTRTNAEVERFMASLTPVQKSRISLLAGITPDEQFNRFLDNLMKMSPQERRNALS